MWVREETHQARVRGQGSDVLNKERNFTACADAQQRGRNAAILPIRLI